MSLQSEPGEPHPLSTPRFVQAPRRNHPLRTARATYLLLFINVLVFALMFRHGPVPPMLRAHQFAGTMTAPFELDTLQHFGGSDGELVLDYGQWWRLLTAIFVHVNLLHLAVNMWCLWNLGVLGEPLLGREGLIATYVLTGVAGNLCSLGLTVLLRQDELVAGASGAVFGIAGILIILLSNKRLSLPWAELRALRRSVVLFAVLNLLIGLAPQMVLPVLPRGALGKIPMDLSPLEHIDNTAHLGGFFCGLAMGLALFPRMMSGRGSYRMRQRVTFAGMALALMLFAYGIRSFHGRPGRLQTRIELPALVRARTTKTP